MQIQIKHRYSGDLLFEGDFDCLCSAVIEAVRKGANLRSADLCNADLCNANLRSADLCNANLRNADLCNADLRSANLRSADLCNADLCNADLRSADLRSADLCNANLRNADLCIADLRNAKGINKYLSTPLYGLLDQIGKIRAYKLVLPSGEGPFNGGIIYELGKTYSVEDACINENEQCASGISLASLDWCLREYREGYFILIAEFVKKDIAAIPIGSDGKFRVHRCKIVGKKDLKELGLQEEKKEEECKSGST